MATGTTVEVVMPQMGVSVSEGTITKWLKQEGETVEADEALLEISTDKVDTEVPSPGSGVVSQILVQEGETVEVGTKLAVIAPEGADAPATVQTPAGDIPEPATQAAADEVMASASEGVGDVAPTSPGSGPVEPAAPPPAPPAPAAAPADGGGGNGRTFVSPVVARIASEHGVDPAQVSGTGRGGRVTKKDILDFVQSGAQAAPAAPAPPAATAPTAPRPRPRLRPRPHRRPRLRPPPRPRPRNPRQARRSSR